MQVFHSSAPIEAPYQDWTVIPPEALTRRWLQFRRWSKERWDRDLFPPIYVGRAADGMPIPAGTELVTPDWRPAPTQRQIDGAEAMFDWAKYPPAAANDPVWPREVEHVDGWLDDVLGRPHWSAWLAPWAITSPLEAAEVHEQLRRGWDSRCIGGVARTDGAGWVAWSGVGSRLESLGAAPTLDDACGVIVEDVRRRRDRVVRAFAGWGAATRLSISASLGNYEQSPITIRVGPHRSEGPEDGAEVYGTRALEVYRVVSGDRVETYPAAVDWDVDAERRGVAAHRRDGDQAARAEAVRLAQRLVDEFPAFGSIWTEGKPELRYTKGAQCRRHSVDVMGPVRAVGPTLMLRVREQPSRRLLWVPAAEVTL